MPLKRSLSPAAAGLAKTPHKRTRPSSSAPAHDVPTPKECEAVHDALIAVHGEPPAQQAVKSEDDEESAPGTDRGTCTSVLDSVFRCMLTLNTNARNYRVGKKGLDERFGRGNYEAIRQAPLEAVVEALRPGGLANVKGKRLKRMLDDVYARNEPKELSLEDLYDLPSDKVKETLLSLHGVGPKVAACVMSYRLGLHEFAVDTHVLRITKSLGWVSQKSNAQQAYVHLNARIPNALKHNHGRACRTCAAAGVRVKDSIEQCPLKPFFPS